MPLSEQEQRLLDEMERNLYRNDADFVPTANVRRGRPSYRAMAWGALLALAGIVGIVLGVVLKQPLIGTVGFIVVLGGVLLAISSPPAASVADPRSGTSPARGKAAAGGFMDRMNERWDQRDDLRG